MDSDRYDSTRILTKARWRAALDALRVLALAVVALVALGPSMAQAWWNDEWEVRKKITIDTSASGANITDPIGPAATLVRLHSGNFRFESAKEDGSDLRFVAGDDKTPLKHHIEKFDSLLGEALIWVAVPNLAPGAKADVWLYYGNKKAVAVNDAKGTYDPDTQLVYHFAEHGTPAIDSSAWANNAQSVGVSESGSLIGDGLRFDGRNSITLPGSPSLQQADGAAFTWSAWIKAASLSPNAALYSRRAEAGGIVIGVDKGAPYVEITNAGGAQRSGAGAPIAAETWRHLAVVANGGVITLYLDGVSYATLNAAPPALNTPATLGAVAIRPVAGAPAPAQPAATGGFVGVIDELQIAKSARSPGFIKYAATGQGADQGKLVAYSEDEEAAGWSSGYFAIILKSVTLDGWIVIGLLSIMAMVSWYVMYDRTTYMNRQAEANEIFMRSFRALTDDLGKLDQGDDDDEDEDDYAPSVEVEDQEALMRRSSIYRVYHIGIGEINRRVRSGNVVLSSASIAAIRASLDSGFVKETQKLNRLMVFLTIAISGGPFLGLLGTVVGVMITFAAIAASGDVNVNAIAPGIAAALVATVAGLAVAIPALFAYNYLLIRIKDLTSDIRVFIDEFVARMAEFYSHERLADRSRIVETRNAAE